MAPFWELPIEQWDVMHRVGLRSHYVATWHAAPIMIANKLGLVVNVSSFGAKIQAVNVAYGVGKAGVDRMTRDMGRELTGARGDGGLALAGHREDGAAACGAGPRRLRS